MIKTINIFTLKPVNVSASNPFCRQNLGHIFTVPNIYLFTLFASVFVAPAQRAVTVRLCLYSERVTGPAGRRGLGRDGRDGRDVTSCRPAGRLQCRPAGPAR